jgi:SAM-dependent methyltransferase
MQPLIDYSRAGEPLVFSRFLPESAPRILVDVGAGDGITGSLSRELIDKGWRAVLIEGHPKLFRNLSRNSNGLVHVEVQTELALHGLAEAGLLLLNNARTAVEVLEALRLQRFHPHLIVTRDSLRAAEQRTRKYDLLSRYGYVYSGLAGAYSIWRLPSDEPPHALPIGLSSLPLSLPDARGQAGFDPLPGDFEIAATGGPREIMISGWAFGELRGPVPPFIWLEVYDRPSGRAEYVQAHRYWRPDVSGRSKRRNLRMSGFRALIPISGRPPKSASLRVVQADGERLFRSDAELLLQTQPQQYEQVAREGLARKFLSGSGIEIGALQRPVPVPRGCQVRYVDRIPVQELRSHYPELAEYPFQTPDFLDDGENLAKIATGSQDFVIANHFFEHSENPVQTLNNLLRVIKRGGILYMAVPDKRYTFDFDRPVTRYEVLKRTYETRLRPDRRHLFEEWATLALRLTGSDAEAFIAFLIRTDYSIHYNVWTLDDLLGFLLQARSDFELPFQMVSAVCCDNEAIILLERT